MQFLWNKSQAGSIWIDQGIDDKVDAFEPCDLCFSMLEIHAQEDARWNDLSLCRECTTGFEMQSAINEVKGLRPYNLDREPERIVLDDIMGLDFLFETPDAYYHENDFGNL